MFSRRKKTKSSAKEETKRADTLKNENLKSSENMIKELLSPWEPYIMTVQSLLVWENAQNSAILLVCINVVFWLATTLKIYYFVGMTCFFAVFIDMWWAKIWPEIRVPIPPEDQEGWTPVHPALLSVPELCHYVAHGWMCVTSTIAWFIELRRKSHAKFFLLTSTLCSTLAFLGTKISGIILSYLIVMGTILIPALIYHNIIQQIYATIQPHVYSVEKVFGVKRKRRNARGIRKKPTGSDESRITDSSEEEILNEFLPASHSAHSSLLTVIDKSLKREDTDDDLLAPEKISRGPSRDHSDYESHDELELKSSLDFSADLSIMPSYDDSLSAPSLASLRTMPSYDDSLTTPSLASLGTIPAHDEIDKHSNHDPDLDLDETVSHDPTATRSAETMEFKDLHFKESSESGEERVAGDERTGAVVGEDDDLMAGLESMPDVDEVLEGEAEESANQRAGLVGQAQALIASEVMTHTVSNIMSSTMSGLSMLGGVMATATGSAVRPSETPGDSVVSYNAGDTTSPEGEQVTLQRSRDNKNRSNSSSSRPHGGGNQGDKLTESVDSDTLLEEFDFLEDEDELSIMEDDKK